VADDAPATWEAFLRVLAGRLGTRPPVRLPLAAAYAYAVVAEMAARVTRSSPVITRHVVRLVSTPKPLSNARIRQTFGFEPIYPDYRQGLKEVLNGVSHDTGDGAPQRCAPA